MRKIIIVFLTAVIAFSAGAFDEMGRRRPKSNGDQTLSMGKKQKKANKKIKKKGFSKKRR